MYEQPVPTDPDRHAAKDRLMLTIAVATFFAVAGVVSLLVIAGALRAAAPQVALLRRNLAAHQDILTVTARLFETVTSVDDGKIVRLPVRARIVHQPVLRDAA